MIYTNNLGNLYFDVSHAVTEMYLSSYVLHTYNMLYNGRQIDYS